MKIFEWIFAVFAFVCLLLSAIALAVGIVIMGIIAISFFASGNILYGILAILAMIGFVICLLELGNNA